MPCILLIFACVLYLGCTPSAMIGKAIKFSLFVSTICGVCMYVCVISWLCSVDLSIQIQNVISLHRNQICTCSHKTMARQVDRDGTAMEDVTVALAGWLCHRRLCRVASTPGPSSACDASNIRWEGIRRVKVWSKRNERSRGQGSSASAAPSRRRPLPTVARRRATGCGYTLHTYFRLVYKTH